MNESASDEEAKIQEARTKLIAGTKENVLDILFGKRNLLLSQKALKAAYDSTEQHPEDGDPRTYWGMAQGLTRYSQTIPYADDRTTIDVAAGKLLQMAF